MSRSTFEIDLDEVTLARARRGEPSACEAIFRLYRRPAYTLALRICQCPQLAQDVIQEAFIKVLGSIRQFRGDAPFWAWLRRVVANQAISSLRREPGPETVEFEEHHAAGKNEVPHHDLAIDLEAALARLDARDRAVVWLHDVEGYGHAEIAALFGLTESFSKTRLARAHARLRTLLGAGGAGPEGDRGESPRSTSLSPAPATGPAPAGQFMAAAPDCGLIAAGPAEEHFA